MIPIITSLLDTDLYKFTMGQIVYNSYRNIEVKYELINRSTDKPLHHVIEERDLVNGLHSVRDLKLTLTEEKYLRGIQNIDGPLFSNDYLYFLKNLELPEYTIEHDALGHWNGLSFKGPWHKVIYWETPALAIVNQLYYHSLFERRLPIERHANFGRGFCQLARKIEALRAFPNVKFVDFGTRRRFSSSWHMEVLKALKEAIPTSQFLGSSNVWFSMAMDLEPCGTMAHEMFMVLAAKKRVEGGGAMRDSQFDLLYDWWNFYKYPMSIVLTDTYGSDFFFKKMPRKLAEQFKGLRQDSGDPLKFLDRAEAFYKGHGIDPKQKTIVFSDGLDVDSMISIADRAKGRVQPVFGWGTNLTNDLKADPLSIVVKVTKVNGIPAVKLSDNISKATGDPKEIEFYKRAFEYNEFYNEATRY